MDPLAVYWTSTTTLV